MNINLTQKFCFKEILDTIPDAMLCIDNDGIIIINNKKLEQLFGYDENELIGKKVECLIPERFINHTKYRNQYVKNPIPKLEVELFGIRKGGIEFPVDINLSPITTDTGNLISAVIRDISERKEIERIIKESNRELELLNQINNAVLTDAPLSQIMNQAICLLNELCYAENVFYYMYDDVENKLVNSTISMNNKILEIIENLAGISLTGLAPSLSNNNIYKEALESGNSFFETDLNKITELFKAFTDKKYLWTFIKPAIKILKLKSFGIVPIVSNNLPLGLFTFNTIKILNQEQIERINRIAAQIALILIKYKNKKQLIENEALYRNTFENAPYGILNFDANGLLIHVNQTFCNMIGYSKEELTNITYKEITHPEDINLSSLIRKKLWNDHIIPNSIQKRYIKKDGSIIWAEVRVGLHLDNEQKPQHSTISIIDITERKQQDDELKNYRNSLEIMVDERTSELEKANKLLCLEIAERLQLNQALLESELRLKFLLTSAPVVIYTCEPFEPFNVTFMADNIYDFLGYTPEMFTSDPSFWLNKVHPEDKQLIYTQMSNILVENYVTFEYRFLNNDGVYKWVHDEVKVIYDNDGNVKEFLGFWIDFSDRKISEEKVGMLSETIQQSPVAVVITSTDGIIEYTNPTFTLITGYSTEEIIGKNPSILKSGKQSEKYYYDLWQTISSGRVWKGELLNRKKNGDLYWEFSSISPIIGQNGKISHYVSIKEDITVRKKMEEDLLFAKEQAELANKTKSEFLANLSHEIRTPMNAIIGFSDILSLHIEDKAQREYLNAIKSSGEILLTLINDILDLSKIEAGKVEIFNKHVNIKHFIDEICRMFDIKVSEKKLNFIINIDDGNFQNILIDEVRLRQILINLLSNAIKFTDNGFVKLSIKVDNSETDKSNLLSKETEYVDLLISVEDSGIGITKEFINNIFEPFTQEHTINTKKYGGTGLGLSITKKLVNMLGGDIWFESNLGKGTAFHIKLKNVALSSEVSLNNVTNKISINNIYFKNSTILIIDDIEENRKYFSDLLQKIGLNTIVANDGYHALELLKSTTPNLIITDIRMPGINGYELLKKIKKIKTLKDIPIIASSASLIKKDSLTQKEKVFDDFVLKPVDSEELISILSKYLPYTILSDSDEKLISYTDFNDLEKKTASLIYIYFVKEINPFYEKIKNRHPVTEVLLFGEKLKEIGIKFCMKNLINYANDIIFAMNNFSIEKIEVLLNDYPIILKNLENKL